DLPIHPRLGRLLLAAARDGCLRAGAALAALVSEKDLVLHAPHAPGDRARPSGRGASDLLVRLDLLAEAERTRFAPGLRARGIDPGGARRVARVREELVRLGRRLPGAARTTDVEPDEATMLRWVVLAYPDRVVRRRGPSDA